MISNKFRNTKSKYKNVKKKIDNHKFDSTAEAEYYLHLKNLEALGKIKLLELQPSCKMTEANIKYIADFLIEENGQEIWLDVKGMITPVFRIKLKLWRHYGQGTLRLVRKGSFGFQTIKEVTTIMG